MVYVDLYDKQAVSESKGHGFSGKVAFLPFPGGYLH
jgi:hypothetical protein